MSESCLPDAGFVGEVGHTYLYIAVCHVSYEWVMSYMNESCLIGIKSVNMWMSHVSYVNESCLIFAWAMPHIWLSQICHMTESCLRYDWIMSHIWIWHAPNQHVLPNVNGSIPTGVCYVVTTYQNAQHKWQKPQGNQALLHLCKRALHLSKRALHLCKRALHFAKEVYDKFSQVYDKLAKLDKAISDFSKAIRLDASNAIYCHNRWMSHVSCEWVMSPMPFTATIGEWVMSHVNESCLQCHLLPQ